MVGWFGAALTTFISSVFLLFFTSFERNLETTSTTYQLYQALPQNHSQLTYSLGFADAREFLVRDFFKNHKSPLDEFSKQFIQVADYYQLDFRLLPAIAMQESNGAKRMIGDSFNPFGFGIYGSKVLKFSTFEDAIEVVGKTLREEYVNQGLTTPEKIMTKYTPPSVEKGGPWAIGVSSFMEEIK
mgnify:FL=1